MVRCFHACQSSVLCAIWSGIDVLSTACSLMHVHRESPIPPSLMPIGAQEDDGCDQKKEDEGAPPPSAADLLPEHTPPHVQRGTLPRCRAQEAQQVIQKAPQASASGLWCTATFAARCPNLEHWKLFRTSYVHYRCPFYTHVSKYICNDKTCAVYNL